LTLLLLFSSSSAKVVPPRNLDEPRPTIEIVLGTIIWETSPPLSETDPHSTTNETPVGTSTVDNEATEPAVPSESSTEIPQFDESLTTIGTVATKVPSPTFETASSTTIVIIEETERSPAVNEASESAVPSASSIVTSLPRF
ncbi:hypothetical protein PMAYCL1PPCAC_19687, partial [Pristionchus mayeri]